MTESKTFSWEENSRDADSLEEIIERLSKDHVALGKAFDAIPIKLSNRPDLHAFLLLEQLVPGTGDILAGADHDIIYLKPYPADVFRAATEGQIRELVACGVFMQDGSLCMFV
jgi:hypothetical protein